MFSLSVFSAISVFSASSAYSLRLFPRFVTASIPQTPHSKHSIARSQAAPRRPPVSTNPADVNGSNRSAKLTPYSRSIRARSIPSNCRNPRNNSSSSALSAVSFSMLLDRQSPALHRLHILRRVMRIRPSLRPRKRMRPRPKSQIRLPPPILQIVLRFKSRLRPIRNFVMVIPRRPQLRLRRLIKLRHLIFARHRPRAIPPARRCSNSLPSRLPSSISSK